MRIAKIYVKRKPLFVKVEKVSVVKFDPRPGWVLVSYPLDIVERRRVSAWFHPTDTHFEWIREFTE